MGTVHAKSNPVGQPGMEEDEAQKSNASLDLASVPAKVQQIHIDGVARTKDFVVVKQVQDVFKATNFEAMVVKAQEAKLKLEQLGIFKNVRISVDIMRGPKAERDGYTITYDVKEVRRVAGGISTLVGTNEGSMLFTLRLPNVFGRAERISSEYTYGTKNVTGYSFSFVKPLNANPKITLSTGVSQQSGEFPWSGYKQTDAGVHAEFNFPTSLGEHSLRWEGTWRDLSCLTRTTAFAVREQAGHSIKSAIKLNFSRDRRDNKILPSAGTLLRLCQEFAGLGGDSHFHKHEVELQVNKSLVLDTVLQLSLAGGIMRPLDAGKDIKIVDQFFLGGPLTLRGFNVRGCGPHSDGCALGADTYWLAAAHLYSPLPFRPGKGGFGELFRTHFFVNAGNLTNLTFGPNMKDNISRLGESYRLAYGAGVVMRLGGVARLELNYCVPVRVQKGDSQNPGLQFGIGVSFL